MNRESFSNHMRKLHLPDEVCSFCKVEFPASTIKTHQITCAAENMDEQRAGMKRGEEVLADTKMKKLDGVISSLREDCSHACSTEPKAGSMLSMDQ